MAISKPKRIKLYFTFSY